MRNRSGLAVLAVLSLASNPGCDGDSDGEAPTPPAAPSGLSATPGDRTVTLDWSPVADATSYAVYYATAPGVTKSTPGATRLAASPGVVVQGLTNGTTYYFVVTAANAAGEGAESSEASATPALVFSQDDLLGTWDRLIFRTNDAAGWTYQRVSVDAAGEVTFEECTADAGPCTVDGTVAWHVDAAGTVRATGTAASPSFHGSLVRSKDLIFATATAPATGPAVASTLQVMRKRLPGVSFDSAEVVNLPFRYHAIWSGTDLDWERGTGTTDASGAITVTSHETASGGAELPPPGFDRFVVDGAGLVTLENDTTFRGFLTSDKKAIFGTSTREGEGAHRFMVLLMSGETFSADDLVGSWTFHSVGSGSTLMSSPWSYGPLAIDAAGHVTYGAVTSPAGSSTPAPFTVSIAPDGTLTRSDLVSYRGLMAPGKQFYVRTVTTNGARSLSIVSRP